MSQGAASDITFDDLNKASFAIRNKIKKYGGKIASVVFLCVKHFRYSFFDANLVVCLVILCGSYGSILVIVGVRGCTTVIPLSNYPPDMTSDELDKALVPIRNQFIKRIG